MGLHMGNVYGSGQDLQQTGAMLDGMSSGNSQVPALLHISLCSMCRCIARLSRAAHKCMLLSNVLHRFVRCGTVKAREGMWSNRGLLGV